MLENSERIEFLKKSHLFLGLTDAELQSLAEGFQEKTFDEEGVVFSEGAVADSLMLILQGSVRMTKNVNDNQIPVASLVKGDYFGEQGLLRGKKHLSTATAESGTILLILSRKVFAGLLKKNPLLRKNMQVAISSRQLAQELNYNWLAENEVIYLLARKHQFLLINAIVPPVSLLVPVFGIMALAYLFSSAGLGLVGGFLLVANLAWGLWRVVDWGNDYYIITNQRVIWLEKVIAFYDSRTEAGMGTILSVSTESDYFGRMVDYGTVIVRTYTGQIRMSYLPHPKLAAALIEEHLKRAKESGKMADEETMRQAIRTKLGLANPVTLPEPVEAETPKPASTKPAKKPSALAAWWQNLFRMRTVDGDTITYHKHIYGFFRDASPYAFGILALSSLVIIWPFIFGLTFPLWLGTLVIFTVIVLFGCIVYQYLDWQNDIYQVTPEQIIDISRKPFGTEDRRAATLENILSTENKRNGILGMLLNFGTVYIMVGTEQYDFEDVADPPSVQQDIVRRQQGRLQKKLEADKAAESERMAEWLAMYHHTLGDIKNENDQSGSPISE